MRGEESTTRRR